MALSTTTWVAAYDVADDRARRRLAILLEAHGPRVLYSVFEVQASDAQAGVLLARAARLLGADDRLLLLPTCPRCRRAAFGGGLEQDLELDMALVAGAPSPTAPEPR